MTPAKPRKPVAAKRPTKASAKASPTVPVKVKAPARKRRSFDRATVRRIPAQVNTNLGSDKKMSLVVDFTGVGSFEPIPEGTYGVQVEEVKLADSSTGKKMLKVKYVVTDDGELKGRAVFRNYVLTEKALFFLKKDCVVLGVDPDLLGGQLDVEELIQEMVGREAVATVTIREYESGKFANDLADLQEATFGAGR